MSDILLFLALLPALFGGYCVLDFLYVRAAGRIVEARVAGFSTKKDKGRFLPVVSYPDEGAAVENAGADPENIPEGWHRAEAAAIDQLSYLVSPAIEREAIAIAVLPGGRVRVYGYLKLVCGALAFLPLLAVLGFGPGGGAGLLTGQAVYILLLIATAVGGWGILLAISRTR